MTSEMRQWQSVLYHALASAQFCNNNLEQLVVLGHFLIAVTKFQDKFASLWQKQPH